MNTSNWGDGRIMQLPDFCFGRRWPIQSTGNPAAGLYEWVLNPSSLPERMVVWSAYMAVRQATWALGHAAFKLAEHIPANVAEFRTMESVFKEMQGPNLGESEIIVGGMGAQTQIHCRHLVRTTARRLMFGFYNPSGTESWCIAGLVISSVPRSVPDWVVERYELKETK